MDFELSEEQRAFADMAKQFADEQLKRMHRSGTKNKSFRKKR